MKKTILISLILLSTLLTKINAQVFVIERGTSTTLTFDNIKSAVDALKDNDRLYIPPGVHDISAYSWTGYDGSQNHKNILVINKRAFIYGAGYNEGANSTIIKGGKFVIGKDAGGSFITGIRFDYLFQLDNVSNCIVSRCKTNSSFQLVGIGNNITVNECEIRSYINNGNGSFLTSSSLSVNYSKCIFATGSNRNFDNATINNCIFESPAYINSKNSSFSNNIFLVSKTVTNYNQKIDGSDNTFSYNLWVGGYPTSDATKNNTFKNCIERETYTNVFVDPDKGDYHLKSECLGKNKGSDGKDVGIYGTAIPFKENKLPSIPSFTTKVISPETDASGKLPVNIVVEAQDN